MQLIFDLSIALAGLFVLRNVPFGFTMPRMCMLAAGLTMPESVRPLPAPLICAVVWYAASTIFSRNPELSFMGYRNLWSHGLIAMVLCLLAYRGATQRTLRWARYGAVAVALAALVDWCAGWTAPLTAGRVSGTIGNPVHLGAFLAVMAPSSGLLSIPMWAAMLAAGSRSAVLAALAGTAYHYRRRISPRAWALLAALGICLVSLLWIRHPASYESDENRLEAWKAAVAEIPGITDRRMILGEGPDTFLDVWLMHGKPWQKYAHQNAHNDLLQALTTTGWIGLALYCWCWCWVWRRNPSGGLLALFLIAKINPLSLEIMAVASVLAGVREDESSGPSFLYGWLRFREWMRGKFFVQS